MAVGNHLQITVRHLVGLGLMVNWEKLGGPSNPTYFIFGLPGGLQQAASISPRGDRLNPNRSSVPSIPGLAVLQACHDYAGAFRSSDVNPGSFEGSTGLFAGGIGQMA